ncbi:MAG: L-aspartate oxidase [Candidatus Riflebacteria bacterium]|nr:L-aspartate oxidase [Candidatus Riflebacteria bacterium]
MEGTPAAFLVIGSGVAGLFAALELAAAGQRVLVLTRRAIDEGNSAYAQGGIATVWDPADTAAGHARDTLVAGAGLCDPAAVDLLVREGPDGVRAMIGLGARFDRDDDGNLLLTREGGHGCRRILHANGDATGRELERALVARVRQEPRIEVREGVTAFDLLRHEGRVTGARALDGDGRPLAFPADRILLASGGLAALFRDTTNPAVTVGDGIVMAWAAGAAVADLEFIQFHPTGLVIPGQPRHLLTEALRGEGAHLLSRSGDRFMPRHHPLAELAPRDIVARAELAEMQRTGDPFVLLDARHLGASFLAGRFPGLEAMLGRFGLSLARDPIPVAPAAHYTIGGVLTDLAGRTTVPGLYAAGEVACTGVHGANRLASNSLLECLVFGRRAAHAMLEDSIRSQKGTASASATGSPLPETGAGLTAPPAGDPDRHEVGSGPRAPGWRILRDPDRHDVGRAPLPPRMAVRNARFAHRQGADRQEVADPPLPPGMKPLNLSITDGQGTDGPGFTWMPARFPPGDPGEFLDRLLGVFRTGPGLDEAMGKLEPSLTTVTVPLGEATPDRVARRQRTVAAALLARFAHARRESRGAHFREDFPAPDPAWQFRQVLTGTTLSRWPGSVE